MGLEFPASATCDKCKRKTVFKLVVTRLKPQVEMHATVPDGWGASSMPTCKPVLVSIPPIAVDDDEIITEDD